MQKNPFHVGLVLAVFFAISFITNILGPLFPAFVDNFQISLWLAGLLPFSFFAAYGVTSIPAGMLIHNYGEKPVMLVAFTLALAGSLAFAMYPVLHIAMISLFMIGAGMAMLQVAINPLLRTAGGEENFAFFSVMAQLVFGGAATLSPLVYTGLTQALNDTNQSSFVISFLRSIMNTDMAWVSMYWLFAIIALLFICLVAVIRLPKVELREDEKVGALGSTLSLFKQKTVVLFFIGIAAYVGTEQGLANGISLFLQRYHGLPPETIGAETVSQFWMMLTIGCLLGLLLLKLIDSRYVLLGFSSGAVLALSCALLGSSDIARIAFPATGFFLSVMWSIIFSLAMNSLAKDHGSFAGILCTGILGGAVASPIVGFIADTSGSLRMGLCFLFIPLAYIFSIGLWAKPLITNKTLSFNESLPERQQA
ncbi:MFS transporter [Microbulbifer sp. ALW1]|uniref:MFS transporter n=1 Tax=Microbulbifer sp. (strain ALW1) TaxID=1516059 RepID=UPI0013578AFD|nr:MFS transporter [Microbulbifer sp. ALW1]